MHISNVRSSARFDEGDPTMIMITATNTGGYKDHWRELKARDKPLAHETICAFHQGACVFLRGAGATTLGNRHQFRVLVS